MEINASEKSPRYKGFRFREDFTLYLATYTKVQNRSFFYKIFNYILYVLLVCNGINSEPGGDSIGRMSINGMKRWFV